MNSEIEITVRGYHCDIFSHVNNARYIEFLEEGRWKAFEKSDVSWNELGELGLTFGVININITYKSQAGVGTVLVLKTSLKKTGRSSITFSQVITDKDSGKLVVDAEVTVVVIDVRTGRPHEVDKELKRRLAGLD